MTGFVFFFFFFRSDIGNRITELNKAVGRIHMEMKSMQQLFTKEEELSANDALTKDGASLLGKYIIGAKNNFRGFNNKTDERSLSQTQLHVTVHQEGGEEGEANQENQPGGGGAQEVKRVTDCDVVKMEEGRVKSEPGEQQRKEEEEEKPEENASEGKDEEDSGADGRRVEDQVKEEVEVESTKTTEVITTKNEKADTKNMVNKLRDIELQERKVQAEWRKDRKTEKGGAKTPGVRETKDKNIPSPTGSSTSQDTGFESQDGEGSTDRTLVSP